MPVWIDLADADFGSWQGDGEELGMGGREGDEDVVGGVAVGDYGNLGCCV